MFNLIALVILLFFATVFVIYKRDMIDLSSFFNSSKKESIKEVLSKDIDRKILIELSRYERFLYSKGFTGRVNIEITKESNDIKRVSYKFYYYNLIEGIHLFIMYNPYSKYRKFYFYFETKYSSGKSTISSIYEKYISSKVPDSIYYFKHSNNTTIEQLYAIHKSERLIKDETIHKERLHIDTLLKLNREDRVAKRKKLVKKRVKRDSVLKESIDSLNGFKLPKIDLFKGNSNSDRATNKTKPLNNKIKRVKVDKKYILTIPFVVIFITLALFAAKYLLNSLNSNSRVQDSQIVTTLDTKQELANFNRNIKLYSGLVSKTSSEVDGSIGRVIDKLSKFYEFVGIDIEKMNSKSKSTINSYLKELDSYIKGKKAPPLNKNLEKIGNCRYPKGLNRVLNWHNGVEEFVLDANLLSYDQIKESIKRGKRYVYLIANRELSAGIAFNCIDDGLYKQRDKNSWKKEFYNIEHLLRVVTKAYKERAFYYTQDGLQINLSRYYKIYRDSLSKEDKDRYKMLVNYLKERAKLYKERGSKELRVRVIKEMKRLYEPELYNSIKAFRYDKNIEVRRLVGEG